jgi:hypothetical protein
MREVRPMPDRDCCECRAKTFGMVLVQQAGLIMKQRGMTRKLHREFLRLRPCCLFLCAAVFFLFPFDRGWGFL